MATTMYDENSYQEPSLDAHQYRCPAGKTRTARAQAKAEHARSAMTEGLRLSERD